MPYQVVVVAFNSRGSGAENQPQTFFSQELIPTDPPESVKFDRSGEYINISWNPLTLNEARGFPVYTVTLTPSTGNDGQQITDGVIVVNTTESSIVVGGLDVNIEYTLTVAVGTTAGQMMSEGGNCPLILQLIVHRPINYKNLKGKVFADCLQCYTINTQSFPGILIELL